MTEKPQAMAKLFKNVRKGGKKKTSTSELHVSDEEGISTGSEQQQESPLHQYFMQYDQPPCNIQLQAHGRRSPSPQHQDVHQQAQNQQIPQNVQVPQQGHEALHQTSHSGPQVMPQQMQPPSHVVGISTGATAGTVDIAQCKPLPEHAGATYNTLNETMGVTVQQQVRCGYH